MNCTKAPAPANLFQLIEQVKREVREPQAPYFDDADFGYYLEKNGYDVKATIYEMLIIKSEDSTIKVSGLNTADTSGYFKRLASRYKQFNSGVLKGG